VGQVVKMEPVYDGAGVLMGYAVKDARSGEILTLVPKQNVTLAPQERS
jgi:hypothetical protein